MKPLPEVSFFKFERVSVSLGPFESLTGDASWTRTGGGKKYVEIYDVTRSPDLVYDCCGTWIRTKMTTFRESHPTIR